MVKYALSVLLLMSTASMVHASPEDWIAEATSRKVPTMFTKATQQVKDVGTALQTTDTNVYLAAVAVYVGLEGCKKLGSCAYNVIFGQNITTEQIHKRVITLEQGHNELVAQYAILGREAAGLRLLAEDNAKQIQAMHKNLITGLHAIDKMPSNSSQAPQLAAAAERAMEVATRKPAIHRSEYIQAKIDEYQGSLDRYAAKTR